MPGKGLEPLRAKSTLEPELACLPNSSTPAADLYLYYTAIFRKSQIKK